MPGIPVGTGPGGAQQIGQVPATSTSGTPAASVPQSSGPTVSLDPASWLSGIGGAMASSLEGGFIALLQDFWKVIAGPVYILIGAVIALFTLGVYFRRPIMGFGKSMLSSGMAAAMMAA